MSTKVYILSTVSCRCRSITTSRVLHRVQSKIGLRPRPRVSLFMVVRTSCTALFDATQMSKPDEKIVSITHMVFHRFLPSQHEEILQAQTPPINLFGFNQIMHVIPDAADWGGAAAWAYLPGQTSAFRSSYSFAMGVQVHEFGHNIGLHHSGYNGASYADHSCLMGEIEISTRCFCNLQSLLW